ncbi:uncharacterized protein ACA1_256580 [Acanthamoeba castellanii str. Neff]|jgi:hypothetical protein|uniref:Uncharacterized protein n=1 Tax=Acanthamoeba castellanii (strain ATCC 30010 / Neff) TaxID=1257118 RepID=L8GF74_ACACF|nr:uncharacterized protein ACA1_256580 [Acanthamoeba castellanii str. Neff]ELR11519.1 hypothetical protein ACA1_256580 [Acanthamoeba castellanii str. Neff]
MKLPTSLRRSKDTPAQETERLLASTPSSELTTTAPSGTTKTKTTRTTTTASGIDKWSDMLTAHDRAVLANYNNNATSPRSNATSPRRQVKDEADQSIQKFRDGEQVAALAALYVAQPAVFAS